MAGWGYIIIQKCSSDAAWDELEPLTLDKRMVQSTAFFPAPYYSLFVRVNISPVKTLRPAHNGVNQLGMSGISVSGSRWNLPLFFVYPEINHFNLHFVLHGVEVIYIHLQQSFKNSYCQNGALQCLLSFFALLVNWCCHSNFFNPVDNPTIFSSSNQNFADTKTNPQQRVRNFNWRFQRQHSAGSSSIPSCEPWITFQHNL